MGSVCQPLVGFFIMDSKMTIRFTLAEKWQDVWFRKLPPVGKLLFLYMCDNCNLAGIWEVDLEQATFSVGVNIADVQGAFKGLDRSYETLNGTHIWLKNFLKHQRNLPLNHRNAAHASIINLLLPYKDLSDSILQLLSTDEIKGLTRGLQSPLSISISKGKSISISKSQLKLFEKFWEAYPKKVARSECLRVWGSPTSKFRKEALEKEPDAEFVEKIVSALEQQKQGNSWQKDNGEFIPNPTTWLNQGRWNDELPRAQTVAEQVAEYERKTKGNEK